MVRSAMVFLKAIAAKKLALAGAVLASMLCIGFVPAVTGNHDTDRLGVRENYQTEPGGRELGSESTTRPLKSGK